MEFKKVFGILVAAIMVLALPLAQASADDPITSATYVGDGTYVLHVGDSIQANNNRYLKIVGLSFTSDSAVMVSANVYETTGARIGSFTQYAALGSSLSMSQSYNMYVTVTDYSPGNGQPAYVTLQVHGVIPSVTPSVTATPTVPIPTTTLIPTVTPGYLSYEQTLHVGQTMYLGSGYSVKLVDLASGSPYPRVSVQLINPSGTVVKQVTMDQGSGLLLQQEADNLKIKVSYAFTGSYNVEAYANIYVEYRIGTPSATPTVIATPIPAQCNQNYFGDGTYRLCIGNLVSSTNGLLVQLNDLSGFGYGTGSQSLPKAIFQVRGPSTSTSFTLVQGESKTVTVDGLTVTVSPITIFPGAFAQESYAYVSVKSGSPTPMPTVVCKGSRDYSGDGTYTLCIPDFADASNGMRVTLTDVSGFSYDSNNKQIPPKATFRINDKMSSTDVSLREGETRIVILNNQQISLYAGKVFPGAFAQQAYAYVSIKSVVTAPQLKPLTAYLTVTPSGSSAVFTAKIVDADGKPVTPEQGVKAYVSYGRETDANAILVSLTYSPSTLYYSATVYRLDSGFYTAKLTAQRESYSASDKASFYITGDAIPLPPETYQTTLSLYAGWNLISSPYSQSSYACTGNCVIEVPPKVEPVVASNNDNSGKGKENVIAAIVSGSASAVVSAKKPAATAGVISAVADVAVNPQMRIMPVPYALRGGRVLSTTCAEATLWHYDADKRQYVKSGALKEGALIPSGDGYWVKVASACSVTLGGSQLETLEGKKIHKGWNQLGSAGQTVSFASISQSCKISSGPWSWNAASKSYEKAYSIEPGKGYFLKSEDSCTLGATEDVPPLPSE